VLAATDLSDPADEALRQAHELVIREGGSLAVCHVAPSEVFIHPLFPERSREEAFATPEWKSRVADLVAARVQRATGRVRGSFEILAEVGSPAAEIVRGAEDWKAERIVVGSHGSAGLARVLVGGVALSVARHAHCPVLIARARAGTRRIVVGTDFSDPALPAVAAAAAESARTGAKVTIVHALEIPVIPTDIFSGAAGHWPAEMAGYQRAREEAAMEGLEAALATAGIDGDRKVVAGSAGPSLVRVAEDVRADLVVVGTRGRTGLRRMLLGSVAEAVVRAAHCSVLVVRLADR